MNPPLRILYLEDNPRDAEIVRDLLGRGDLPCDLEVVPDRAGYEAAVGGNPYDLVLSDFAMPGYDGMAALALAREKQPDVPFILVSGMLGEERAVECMRRGATDYVLKERPERLGPAVKRALAEAEAHRARGRAEEALRKSEASFRTIFEMASIGIVQADPLTGRFLRVNRKYCEITGYSEAELLRKGFSEITHPDDRESDWAQFQRVVQGERQSYRVEKRYIRRDGSVAWVNVNASIIRDDAGRPERTLAAIEDITERKGLESQVRQAQKMEAIGQLAGGVAHDFNNILAAIMMHLGLLQMSVALEEETQSALKELEAEARRAASLTRQLLMFSRRSVLLVKPLNLNEVVANLLKMLGRLIGEQIELRFHRKTSVPSVEADAGLLEQVIMNLVVNARDAMPKGGNITISTSFVELREADATLNPLRRRGNFVCLAVSDSGVGMDDATMKRIFEPFFTTKEAGKGTGLGLATAHGIVAQHKGWIEVESAPGKGSTLLVYLPAMPEASGPVPEQPATKPLRQGSETILVVEDDAKVRYAIQHALRVLGYRVFEASNGQEAMRVWQAHEGEVQLLITDMVMPEGITGLDLAERLQAMGPGLRTIISSGYSAEIVQAGVPNKAGVVYLPKPYSMDTLAEVVRNCLDRVS